MVEREVGILSAAWARNVDAPYRGMGRCCIRLATGFARDNRFPHGPKLADLMADWRGLQGGRGVRRAWSRQLRYSVHCNGLVRLT